MRSMVIFIIHLQGQLLYRCIFFIRNEELDDAFLLLNYEFRKLNKLASAFLLLNYEFRKLNKWASAFLLLNYEFHKLNKLATRSFY